MPMIHHFHTLLDTLDHTTTVLTVDRQLAHNLRQTYDAKALADGLLSWEAPDILPLSAWVRRNWAEYGIRSETPLPLLLAPAQEQALWERIIRKTVAPGEELLQLATAARDAKEAWTRIKGWRVPEGEYSDAGNDNTRIFSRWVRTFMRLCRIRHWIDAASALDSLIPALRAQKIPIRARIIFAGFHEFTPQQQTLRDTLEQAGVAIPPWGVPTASPPSKVAMKVHGKNQRTRSLASLRDDKTHLYCHFERSEKSFIFRGDGQPSVTVRVRLPDQEKELESAARWARALLEDGIPGPIGIVIPELSEMRSAVSRIFDKILCPEAAIPGADTPTRPFEVSLGQPLGEMAPIRDAILALTLAEGPHPLPAFSRWLLSPYFSGAETEFTARARADATLRARGDPWTTLPAVCHHLSESRKAGMGKDAPLCPSYSPHEPPSHQTLTHWAQTFAHWLDRLGWPGERILNSEEHQAVAAFQALLVEFGDLDPVLPEQSFAEALSRLRRMATMHRFQPKSNLTPVRILGIPETAGLWFSHLWILGLHAESWPAARPNPYLPVALQRRVGMPQSSPALELSRARRTTDRMLGSADHVIVSHPQRDGDLPRYPNPCIAMLPKVDLHQIPQSPIPDAIRRIRAATNPDDKERLSDDMGPAIRRGEPIGGGTRIWQDQAACPFRAFARRRLGASGLDAPTIGLDHAMRGILTHRALELIWRELWDSDRLRTLATATLQEKVTKAVRQALLEAAARRPETFRGNRLRQLEETRLTALILAWLEQEKERPPFTVVAPERKRTVRFGGIPVVIRPDRMDRTREGQHLLLDYKTGDSSVNAWFGERPAEPQLPLYALMAESDGIALAFVRRGRIGFQGIADFQGAAPGIETLDETKTRAAKAFGDWEMLRGEWRRVLLALAESFARGDARVDPKFPQETCRNCDLHSLCRVYAQGSGWR